MIWRRGRIVLILFSFWILAAALPAVRFAPANWDLVHQRLGEKPPSLGILLGGLLILAVVGFAGLLGLSFWGTWRRKGKDSDHHQIYREPVPVPGSVYAVLVLLAVLLAGFIWWARQPSGVPEPRETVPRLMESLEEKATPKPTEALPRVPPERERHQSKWVEVLLAIGLLAGLGWVAWRVWGGRREAYVPETVEVGSIFDRALTDLEKGEELSDVVLRCYRDMCAILGRKVALRDEMTAREFAQRLHQAGVGEEEVVRLTHLFERVRYGRQTAGPAERAEAVALLQAIQSQYGKGADET